MKQIQKNYEIKVFPAVFLGLIFLMIKGISESNNILEIITAGIIAVSSLVYLIYFIYKELK